MVEIILDGVGGEVLLNGVLVVPTPTPTNPITIDGTISGSGAGSGVSVTLSTTNNNDIIIVYVSWDSSGADVLTIADTAGLTWHTRNSDLTGNNTACTREYYAVAATALTLDVITVIDTSNASNHLGVMAFGLNSVNTSTPFDANVSLPAKTNQQSSTTDTAATISTTSATDIIILFANVQANSITPLTYSGNFANIMTPVNFTGNQTIFAAYATFTAAQTSLTIIADWTASGNPGASSLLIDGLVA